MRRSTIVRLFWGSLIALASGALLLVATTWLALVDDVLVTNGPDVVGVRSGGLAALLIGLVVLAALVTLAASIGLLAAWVGAVLNTAELPGKAWFVVLLVVGLLGFAFIATLVYVIAGPDGTAHTEQEVAAPEAPAPRLEATGPARHDGQQAEPYAVQDADQQAGQQAGRPDGQQADAPGQPAALTQPAQESAGQAARQG